MRDHEDHPRMRFILVLLIAGGLTAESIPFLDMTYVAGDGLEPPAPMDGWWKRTLTDSQAWCTECLGGVRLELPRAVHVRITTHTDQTGSAMPEWSARWDGPLSDVAGATIGKRVATWKNFRCTINGNMFALAGPGGGLDLPSPGHGAGWRLTVHGAGVDLGVNHDIATNPAYKDLRDQLATQDLRTLIRTMTVTVGLDPAPGGAQAWIDAGLRAAWFRPIDSTLIDRIPADAHSVGAIGINGVAVAEAISGLPDSLRLAMGLGALQAGMAIDPVAAARSADGTWIAYANKQGFLIRMPRSHLLDTIMGMVGQQEEKKLPVDDAPARVNREVVWARDDHEWLFADSEEAIVAWRTAKPGGDMAALGGRPPMGSRVWAVAGGEVLKEVIPEIFPGLMPELPLSVLQPKTEEIMKDLGLAVSDDVTRFSGVEEIPVRITDQVVGEQLRLCAQGGVLPWIIPGLGIAWCAATIQEQEGRNALLARLAVERAAGQPATPRDLLATLPEPVTNEAAIITGLAQSGKAIPGLNESWKQFVAGGAVLAKDKADPAMLAAIEQLIANSTFIDGVSPETISAAALRSEAAAGRRGFDSHNLTGKPARLLNQAGRCLMTFGDVRGVLLVERARILVGRPFSLIDGLMQSALATQRNEAIVVGDLLGLVPEAQLSAWLAETPPLWFTECMHMEAISTPGALAEAMLDDSANPVSEWLGHIDLRPSLLTSASMRGSLHSDLVTIIDFLHWLANNLNGERPAIESWRSSMPGLLVPAVSMVKNREIEGALRHQMMRLAVRVRRAGPLADQAAAIAAVGPLSLSVGNIVIPLVYTALPTGFTLAPDPETKPAGVSDSTWKKFLTPEVGEAAVSFPSRGLSVRISRGTPRKPELQAVVPPGNDF